MRELRDAMSQVVNGRDSFQLQAHEVWGNPSLSRSTKQDCQATVVYSLDYGCFLKISDLTISSKEQLPIRIL
jgi:hypothetical protein